MSHERNYQMHDQREAMHDAGLWATGGRAPVCMDGRVVSNKPTYSVGGVVFEPNRTGRHQPTHDVYVIQDAIYDERQWSEAQLVALINRVLDERSKYHRQ